MSRLLNKLLIVLAPLVYKGYMQLVFHTSSKTFIDFTGLWQALDGGENAVGAVVHQDILLGFFTFRGREIVTMASQSRDGDISTRVMEKSGFVPIRGSSSRNGLIAMKELIDYVNARKGILAGITVDGPRGPAFEPKMGAIYLAKSTGAAIYPIRSWAKRRHHFSNWDRTALPLPFNDLVFICGEPIRVPDNAGRSKLEELRLEVKARLAELTERATNHFTKNKVSEPDYQNVGSVK